MFARWEITHSHERNTHFYFLLNVNETCLEPAGFKGQQQSDAERLDGFVM